MSPIKEIFIINLISLRKAKKLSQAQLAEKANISNGIIGEIETGHANPNLSTIEKIANALEVPVYQLLYDVNSEYNYSCKATTYQKKQLLLKLIDELTQI